MGATTLDLDIPRQDNDKDRLVIKLLTLALSKVDIKPRFEENPELVSEARLEQETQSNKIQLIWAGMSPEREETLYPIRVPIFKGILGHRIFVIRNDAQHKFNHIRTLSDLQQLKAGAGTFWGDTQILKNADLPTVTTVKGVNLWDMLDGSRFDYFPLAIHEPWGEMRARTDLELTVEKNVMLVYPFAMYFYVSRENTKLHRLIKEGMQLAIQDGSYDEFLFNDPIFKAALIDADVSKRTVVRIGNPFMHPETPVDIPEYWLDPTKLSAQDLANP